MAAARQASIITQLRICQNSITQAVQMWCCISDIDFMYVCMYVLIDIYKYSDMWGSNVTTPRILDLRIEMQRAFDADP